MNKVFVFCIGGTGIRVMKSITMLMAAGMSTNDYIVVPIIVDPHMDLEEKKKVNALIDNYRQIYRDSVNNGNSTLNHLHGFFNSEIRTIEELGGDMNDTHEVIGSNEKFGAYINRSRLGNNDINNYFIDTLFSTKNLNSPLSVGFKGNPNMGTVVLGGMIEGSDWFKSFKQHCEKGDRVFIISSIFGGTGASGFPLLEKKIKLSENLPAVKNAIVGAVTVLPYYGLKDPTINNSDIDSANFYTKTKAALAYYHNNIKSDYLYYVGEKSLKQTYENDEKKQEDTANFIELVAASALFDFLKRGEPKKQQFLTRAIHSDDDSLDLDALGDGYADIVKCIADFMLLEQFVKDLPNEEFFPLKKTRGFNADFFRDAPYRNLETFVESFYNWYKELAQNKRAFSPLNYGNRKKMGEWVNHRSLDAKNDSYYILEMIKASNRYKSKEHENKFRYFLQFVFAAIDKFTNKLLK